MNEPSNSTGREVAGQAQQLAGQASERAGSVATQAADQAKAVAQNAKEHARDVVGRTRRDVEQQAEQRSGQAAEGLRSLADNVRALAEGRTDEAGPLVHYLHDAGDRLGGLAGRFDQGPQAVMGDVRRFARQRPLAFLGLCGALGFAAGRLVRAGSSGDGSSGSSMDYSSMQLGGAYGAVDPVLAPPSTGSASQLTGFEASATKPPTPPTPPTGEPYPIGEVGLGEVPR